MNRHNGFVTCAHCGCVTREKKCVLDCNFKTMKSRIICANPAKCAKQMLIRTERDRRIHAALQAQHDRDVDRQMGYEMKAYFTGMS